MGSYVFPNILSVLILVIEYGGAKSCYGLEFYLVNVVTYHAITERLILRVYTGFAEVLKLLVIVCVAAVPYFGSAYRLKLRVDFIH